MELICRDCGRKFEWQRPEGPETGFSELIPAPTVCGCVERTRPEGEYLPYSRQAAWLYICPPSFRDTKVEKLPDQTAYARAMGWQFGPRGLLLHGPTGAGKSRTAYLVLQREFHSGRDCVAFGSGIFGLKVGEHFANGEGPRWMGELWGRGVLLLDDLGKSKLTERVEECLFSLIDRRISMKRPTIITTQFVGDSLAATMAPERGQALVRRLREEFLCVAFSRSDI